MECAQLNPAEGDLPETYVPNKAFKKKGVIKRGPSDQYDWAWCDEDEHAQSQGHRVDC